MGSADKRRNWSVIKTPRNTAQRYFHRLLVGVPTLGQVRMEWHNAISAIVIPTNFSNSLQTPIGFSTADAQNILVKQAIDEQFDWLLLIEDDVLPPADILIKLRPYMQHARYPVVAGLYHVKGNRPEPMIYRGRGNGPFLDWKPGSKVWCDGLPTGCTLIHRRLLEVVAEASETYYVRAGQPIQVQRVFETPRVSWTDERGANRKLVGTSDLYFCDRVRSEKLLEKAGWKALQKKRYPFLVDTSISCGHIDRSTGFVF